MGEALMYLADQWLMQDWYWEWYYAAGNSYDVSPAGFIFYWFLFMRAIGDANVMNRSGFITSSSLNRPL